MSPARMLTTPSKNRSQRGVPPLVPPNTPTMEKTPSTRAYAPKSRIKASNAMPGRRNAARPNSMAIAPRSARAHQCPVSAGSAGRDCGWVMRSSFGSAASTRRRARPPRHDVYIICGAASVETAARRTLRLLGDGVAAGALGAVEGLVGGAGEGGAGLAVFGVGRDAQRERWVDRHILLLKVVVFDAAPYLLGDLKGFVFREAWKDGLVLVTAEAGGLASFLLVQPADDAPDLPDDVLAEEVAVGVVDLLQVVYVGHEHAQGLPRGRCRFEGVLELCVEAVLDEEAGQIVAADQAMQGAVEVRPHGVSVRVLEHRVADEDPVPVRERSLALENLAVDGDVLAGAEAPQYVALKFGLADDPRVLGRDLDVPDHYVRQERVAPQDQGVTVEREEVAEAGPTQDDQMRPLVRKDCSFFLHDWHDGCKTFYHSATALRDARMFVKGIGREGLITWKCRRDGPTRRS